MRAQGLAADMCLIMAAYPEVRRSGPISVHVYEVAGRIAKSTRDSDLALVPAKQHTVFCL